MTFKPDRKIYPEIPTDWNPSQQGLIQWLDNNFSPEAFTKSEKTVAVAEQAINVGSREEFLEEISGTLES